MRIGIMGGTFNPIHNGHLIQCENIRERKGLDKIIIIPTNNPPHKIGKDILESHIRLDMVRLAIESNPYFLLSEIEINRPGLSYTLDTIGEIKVLYPDDELFLIVGADSMLEIHSWWKYEEILSSIKILVVDRYNSTNLELEKVVSKYNALYGNNIENVPSPIIDISSTDIRKRLSLGLSIKYMVPEAVEEYIIKNRLYMEDSIC